MIAKPASALVIVGHGSTVDADSSAPTRDHAETIGRQGIFGEVYCAFWKEEPSLRQVLHMADRDEIYVVPNFISEGYFTQTVIPRELELSGPFTQCGGRTIKYCQPSGSHPRVTDLLLKRAAEAAPEVDPKATTLLIAGHGTGLNDHSGTAAKREAERIRERRIYAEVRSAYLEESPLVSEWDALSTQPNVVVVPFFIADGPHSLHDIPALLGIEPAHETSADERPSFRKNPYRLRGKTLYYASAIGTEALFAEVILDQVEAFDANRPPASGCAI